MLTRKQKKEKKTKKSTKGVSAQLEAELEYHTAQANGTPHSLTYTLTHTHTHHMHTLTHTHTHTSHAHTHSHINTCTHSLTHICYVRTHSLTHSHTHTHTASIPSLRTLLPVVLLKSCFSLAQYSWFRYSEWKETAQQLKQQQQQQQAEANKQQQQKEENSEKESSEEESTQEKRIKRRSGRKSTNEHQRHDQSNQVCQDDQVDTVNNVYESGGYEDQLEAIMNDLEDDSYESKPKKSPKIRDEQVSLTHSKTPNITVKKKTVKPVENIGATSQKTSMKELELKQGSLNASNTTVDNTGEKQCRYHVNVFVLCIHLLYIHDFVQC